MHCRAGPIVYGAPADAPMVLAFDTATLAVDATHSVDTESVPAGREERRGSADTAGRLSTWALAKSALSYKLASDTCSEYLSLQISLETAECSEQKLVPDAMVAGCAWWTHLYAW